MLLDPSERQKPCFPPHANALNRQTTNSVGRRQLGLDIASFGIAIVTCVSAFALVVIAGVMKVSTPGGIDEKSPQAVIVELGLCAVVAINLLGVGLGVAGLIQAHRLRTFGLRISQDW